MEWFRFTVIERNGAWRVDGKTLAYEAALSGLGALVAECSKRYGCDRMDILLLIDGLEVKELDSLEFGAGASAEEPHIVPKPPADVSGNNADVCTDDAA